MLAKLYVPETTGSAGPLGKAYLPKIRRPGGALAKVYLNEREDQPTHL